MCFGECTLDLTPLNTVFCPSETVAEKNSVPRYSSFEVDSNHNQKFTYGHFLESIHVSTELTNKDEKTSGNSFGTSCLLFNLFDC